MLRFTTLALMLAAAAPAHADELTDKYRESFRYYGRFAFEVNRTPSGARIDNKSPDDCVKEIAKAKLEGVPANTVFTLDYEDKLPKKVPFSEIQQTVCVPFERAVRIAQVAHAIYEAQDRAMWITQINKDTHDPEEAATLLETAKQCTEAAALVDGLGAGDYELHLEQLTLHMDEANEKVCIPLMTAAKAFGKEVTAAKAAREAEQYGPFKKAGIGGDKLEVCGQNWRSNIRGVGGGVLSPAQIKKASVLFVRLGPATDTGLYSLRRFAFKGDKLVSSTEKNFIGLPGAGAFK